MPTSGREKTAHSQAGTDLQNLSSRDHRLCDEIGCQKNARFPNLSPKGKLRCSVVIYAEKLKDDLVQIRNP